MASFVENLWGSVFTPGTTPTLLVATNAAFAALQVLLFALLIATYSIHFLVLSVLCGGLWYSINWFAIELRAAQQKEEEAERLRKKASTRSPTKDKDWKTRGEVADSADDEGEETETETEGMKGSAASIRDTEAEQRVRDLISDAVEEKVKEPESKVHAAASGQSIEGSSTMRQRSAAESDRSGEVSSSTDSEWEKVEDDR